jgi:AraC-like DNA-binding protein
MIGKTRQLPDQPRGVLGPGSGAGVFDHQRRLPSPGLAELVEHFWYVSWNMQGLSTHVQETLPHPNVHLVIEEKQDGIYGVHTARYTRLLEGKSFAFGVKFRAGGFQPFLGASVAGIADLRVPLDTLFGADGLAFAAAVRTCQDADAMLGAAEKFLLDRLPARDANTALAAKLVAEIAADTSMTSVDTLEAHSGLNKRTLQRLFQRYVGVGPKWVIKRYRIHEAVAQIQSGTPIQLSQLALELGYFDQSHFIRDFTSLVGKPPGEYARQFEASKARA